MHALLLKTPKNCDDEDDCKPSYSGAGDNGGDEDVNGDGKASSGVRGCSHTREEVK